MQILIFLLVLLNALFFAFSHGLSGQNSSLDAQRLNQQIAPERIEILSRGAAPTPTQSCLSWLLPSQSAAQALLEKIDKTQGSQKLDTSLTPLTEPRWWVAIPGLSNLADANKKASQVRTLGVDTFSPVESNTAGRFALSFGVFPNESVAQSQLEKLKASGVRSATIIEQAPGSTIRLQLRGQSVQLLPIQNHAKKWQPEASADGPHCF